MSVRPRSLLLTAAALAAVAVVAVLSWQLLRVDGADRAVAMAAAVEIAALVACLRWPGITTTAVLAVATLAAAVVRWDGVVEIAWVIWVATMLGLGAMSRALAARGLPEAVARPRRDAR
ncbi:MAG: hypothetical protein R3B06_12295 [Kofleriaceae bacterium]